MSKEGWGPAASMWQHMHLAAHAPGQSPGPAASQSAPTPPSCPAPQQRRCRLGLRGSRQHGIGLAGLLGLCSLTPKGQRATQIQFDRNTANTPGEDLRCTGRNGAQRYTCFGGQPARMMQVTTGVSSLDSASASTPPTERVSPSFANSRTNCTQAVEPQSELSTGS